MTPPPAWWRATPRCGAVAAVAALALLASLLPGRAHAEPPTGEAHAGFHVFAEPASGYSVIVLTPDVRAQVDVRRWLRVRVDWNADVVSGATPRVYGARDGGGIDAVSAATRFKDLRNAVGAELETTAGPFSASVGYHFGIENDYRSHVVSAGARLDLAQHNTILAARYAHNFDSVCDLDNRVRDAAGALRELPTTQRQPLGTSTGCFAGVTGLTSEPLAIDGAELSWTQTFTPHLLMALVGAYEHLDGFQSNPYRRVRLLDGMVLAQESHPRLRDRGALALRARYAFAHPRAVLGADVRLYRDTWDIQSVTAELSWEQLHLGDRLRWRLRARYYQQTRAVFYRDAGEANSYERAGPVGQYFTGDRELSPFADLLLGGLLAWRSGEAAEKRRIARLFRSWEADLTFDLVKVFALTPEPPTVERTRGAVNALLAGVSLTATW